MDRAPLSGKVLKKNPIEIVLAVLPLLRCPHSFAPGCEPVLNTPDSKCIGPGVEVSLMFKEDRRGRRQIMQDHLGFVWTLASE